MSLPIVKYATHTTELKNYGTVSFRCFNTNEQKSLLSAIELGDESSIFHTTLQIVDVCTDDTINANELTEAEIEFLFLQIYIHSVQNKSEAMYICHNIIDKKVPINQVSETETDAQSQETDDNVDELSDDETVVITEECGTEFKVVIPIEEAYIKYPDNYDESKNIKVNDEIEINLKIPSAKDKLKLSNLQKVEGDKKVDEDTLDLMLVHLHIDSIVDLASDTTYDDIDFKEFEDWFGNLNPVTVEKIASFIKNPPVLAYDFKFTCPNPECKNKENIKFRGLQSFFE